MTMVIHDQAERDAALEITRSFVVRAPAGSGKTELLIQRFLKLLAQVERPENILAMTFTRKAAGEMRTRIIRALTQAAGKEEPTSEHALHTYKLARAVLEQDHRREWNLLDNPLRLKIQTIDSFCMSLIKQTPVRSGIGAALGIEENTDALYRETARRLLARVEEQSDIGASVRILLKRLDNSKSAFLDRMIQLLRKRDRWILTFFDDSMDAPPAAQNRTNQETILKDLIEARLQEVHSLIGDSLKSELFPLLRYAGENVYSANPDHELAVLKDLQSFPQPLSTDLAKWKALAKILVTGGGQFRKKVDVNLGFPPKDEGGLKEFFKEILASLQDHTALAARLSEIGDLPHPQFEDPDWDFLQSMFRLLPEIEKILRQVFVETGNTDYSELSLSALKALGNENMPTDLLLKYDLKLQHILVDEFQDTSFKQYLLLSLLTEGWTPGDGRTLFIVGDPMQSIYRFRDAEVYFFNKAVREGIGPVRLEELKLRSNFRSQENLVDWVNACFETLDRETSASGDGDLEGAIRVSQSKAVKPAELDSAVVHHPFLKEEADQEAVQMIGVIRQLQTDHPRDSIAVLVRSRSHLESLVPQLKDAGISLRAENIDKITTRPAVLDLWSLMRALLDPHDRIAWLSILRAPFCGLKLKDIHVLCRMDKETPMWLLMNDPVRKQSLTTDGKSRLQRLIGKLSPVLDAMPAENFRDLLEGCWIDLAGPACVDRSQLQDIEVFFEEVSKTLSQGDYETLFHFDRVLDGLYASPSAMEGNPVRVITMHQAKGLEFDFVLLPGLGKKPQSGEKQLIFWLTHSDHMLFAPIQETGKDASAIYNFLDRLNKFRDQHETRRLLYVSATRARKQLHLFGHVETDQSGKIKTPPSNSMLRHLWPFVEKDWNSALNSKVDEPATQYRPKPKPPRLRRLPRGFDPPPPPPEIDTGRPLDIREEREDRPPYFWAGNEARYLGNVLHRCFKDIAEQGLDTWTTEKIRTIKPVLKAALLNEGLSFERAESVAVKGVRALENALTDEKYGRWILSPHEDGHSEFALTRASADIYSTKIIDRTFVDEDGVRWIIDYKTGEHEGSDLDGFLSTEKERYAPQLQGYAQVLRARGETRPIRLALYYPLHQKLVEIPESDSEI